MQIFYLKSQPINPASPYLCQIIHRVLRAQHHEYVIDRIHGHLWSFKENEQITHRCACECYSASDRFQNNWKDFCFDVDNAFFDEKIKLDDEKNDLLKKELYPKYLDNLQMRTNAFRTAIETAMNVHLTSVCL